jgi:phosphoserine phosphatase RsbU/P
MGRNALVVATSEKLTAAEARFVQLVLSAWPDGATPRLARLTFAQLMHHSQSPDGFTHGLPVCMIFVARTDAIEHVDRCLSDLRQTGISAVLLVEDEARWKPLQGHGIIVRPWNAAPDAIAAMLFALLERQHFVDALSREVSILQRCQVGVRAEVERIHEELHLAAGVQHEFTSTAIPKIPELDIDVIYRPVNAVSGDIYNVRQISPTLTAFFIADAVGHGVPAALLTMILTSTLITAEHDFAPGLSAALRPSPKEVIDRLNRRLVASSLQTGRFATGVYGVIDSSTGVVTIAGAGHPAPFVLGRAGLREIVTQGPLLGVFDDAEFDQATTVLQPGESLVIYTDGLEAAFPHIPGETTRDRHIHHAAAAIINHRTSTFEAMRELETVLDEQSGSLHQADDITLLAITMRGPAKSKHAAA